MRARGDFLTVVGGLGELEAQFLDSSLALRDRRAQEEKARQQRELEAAQRLAAVQKIAAGRLQKGLAVAVVLLIASIVGVYFGWTGQKTARKEADTANQALSQSDFLRASDLVDQDEPREALAFLARACRTNPANSAAASQLFFLLSQKEWILPITEPLIHNAGKGPAALLEYVRFSPDGSKVVATSWAGSFGDGTAQVWDIKSKKLLLDQVPCNIYSIAFLAPEFPYLRHCLPDERCFRASLVLIPHGNEVQVCDLQQGKVRMTLPHAAKVTAVQFSAKENKVLTGDEGGEVTLWDIDGKVGIAKKFHVAGSKPALKGAVMAFNRPGTQAVVGTPETIEIWQLDAARESATPIAPRLGSKLEAVSEDGRHVLIGDTLYSYDPDTGLVTKGPTLAITPPEKDRQFPMPAAFSKDGKWIAILTGDRQIQLQDTENRDSDFSKPQNKRPRSDGVVNAPERMSSSHLYFSSDASLIASIFKEESIQIWNTNDKTQSRESLSDRQPFTDVAFSPDGRTIATASYSGNVQIWDIRRALPESRPISLDSGLKDDPDDIVAPDDPRASWKLSEDGRFVLLTVGAEERKIFDSQTGKPATAPAGVAFPKEPETRIENQSVDEQEKKSQEEYSLVSPVTGKPPTPPITVTRGTTVRWSRDGKRFLTLTSVRRDNPDKTKVLTIRNATTSTQLREPLECLNAWFSFAGDAVLIATRDRETVVMDIATGRDLAVLPNMGLNAVILDAVWTSEGITVLVNYRQD